MNVTELKKVFNDSALFLRDQEAYLCAVDAETGDGDCGVAVSRIANAIIDVATADGGETTIGDFMSAVSAKIMSINGGSSVPLWAMIFDGMSDASEDAEEVDAKALLAGALEGIQTVSNAKVGEKTMMDALIPATQAAQKVSGDNAAVMDAAAEAAKAGAEATKDMVAKYGRAKNLLEDSKGHYDAGALAVSLLINALRDNSKK